MNLTRLRRLCIVVLGCGQIAAAEPPVPDPVVLRVLGEELARADKLTLDGSSPPYYVAYAVTDMRYTTIRADLGSLVQTDDQRARALQLDVRVGDYHRDSTPADASGMKFARTTSLPLDHDPDVIRRAIWLATDDAYKSAVATLDEKRGAEATTSDGSAELDDFARAAAVPVVSSAPTDVGAMDLTALEELARRLSAALGTAPGVTRGDLYLTSTVGTRWLVSSEGVRVVEPVQLAGLNVVVAVQASDGMEIRRHLQLFATSFDKLPAEAVLTARLSGLAQEASRAAQAELLESFEGPVIFEGEAAAQLARIKLAGALAAYRAPAKSSMARAFESPFGMKIGQTVLPKQVSIYDDPKAESSPEGPTCIQDFIDAQGVPAARVELVKSGILSTLLATRAPVVGVTSSNGHARGQLGAARPSMTNFFVVASQGLPRKALRKKALALAKREGDGRVLVVRALAEPVSLGEPPGPSKMFGFFRNPDALPPPQSAVLLSADGSEKEVRGVELDPLSADALRAVVAFSRERTRRCHGFGDDDAAGQFQMPPVLGERLNPFVGTVVAPDFLFARLGAHRDRTSHQAAPESAPPPR